MTLQSSAASWAPVTQAHKLRHDPYPLALCVGGKAIVASHLKIQPFDRGDRNGPDHPANPERT